MINTVQLLSDYDPILINRIISKETADLCRLVSHEQKFVIISIYFGIIDSLN